MMKVLMLFAPLALCGLLSCAGDQAEQRTGQEPPPTQTPVEEGLGRSGAAMSQTDRALARQVENALRQDPVLASAAENIQVAAANGEITLRGAVNNAQEKTNLGSAAARVAGVTEVDNEVEVNSARR